MAKVIISQKMINEGVSIMKTTLREVETLAKEEGINPEPIKELILGSQTIPEIEKILFDNFGDRIKIVD